MRSEAVSGGEWPLAYLLTFTRYGTWRHGSGTGSVDRAHNAPGTPAVEPHPARATFELNAMRGPAYWLEGEQPSVVLAAIRRLCWRRRWEALAVHVRRAHIHAVVAAGCRPEPMVAAMKAESSRALTAAGCGSADTHRSTRHGSTRYLWDEDAVAAAIEYVLYRQGEPVAVWPCDEVGS